MAYETALDHHVRRRLQIELGVSPVVPDAEGDYCWTAPEGLRVWFRHHRRSHLLQVWCCAAVLPKATAAVLRELNAWNSSTPFVRAACHDGEVVVISDVDLESMSSGHLERVATAVARAARGLGEALVVTAGAVQPLVGSEHSPLTGAEG